MHALSFFSNSNSLHTSISQFSPRRKHGGSIEIGRPTLSFSCFRAKLKMGLDGEELQTLGGYMAGGGANVGDDLVVLMDHLQYACKRIAALVASPANASLGKKKNNKKIESGGHGDTGTSNERDDPKPLDIVSVQYRFA